MERITKEIRFNDPDAFEARLKELNKRAKRLGANPIVEISREASPRCLKPTTPLEGGSLDAERPRPVIWTAVIEYDLVRVEGWQILARLDAIGEKWIAVGKPGVEIDLAAVTPFCDHCKTHRRRKSIYVLQDEEGQRIQVGRTCLDDFVNQKVERLAAWSLELDGWDPDDDDKEFFGGGHNPWFHLDEYLPLVACAIREWGWVSRGKARVTGDAPTSDLAWNVDRPCGRRADETHSAPEDHALAAEAIEWAKSLDASSSYETSIQTLAEAGVFHERKHAGIAASIVAAYKRTIEREENRRVEREENPITQGYVGEPKQRREFKVRVLAKIEYTNDFGGGVIHKMRDEESGKLLVWFCSGIPLEAKPGDTVTIKGTIKKHDTFNGETQTLINRCVEVSA